jgi:hypothetical protein
MKLPSIQLFHVDKRLIFQLSLLTLIVITLSAMMFSSTEAADQDQAQQGQEPRFTATALPECDNLAIYWDSPPFSQNSIRMAIHNNNPQWVELQSVQIKWNDIEPPWNNMYLGSMSLVDSQHWSGSAAQNVKANGQTSVTTGPLTLGNRTISGGYHSYWTAQFFDGPQQMDEYMTLLDFGMIFRFRFLGGLMCDYFFLIPGDATPTPTFTPTATQTCEASIQLTFGGFSTNGAVWFNVTNYSGQNRRITGFNLVWPDATHRDITSEPSEGYGLARVFVGGSMLSEGTMVWQADPPVRPGNTNLSEPYNNRTDSSEKGTWLTDGILYNGMTTRIYLDFDDVSGNLKNYGAQPWHFDRSRFRISACDSNGTVVATSTPTSTMVDLPTDEGSTATPTPLPPGSDRTLTPDMTNSPSPTLVELLPNTSFEIDADGDKIPDGWQVKNIDVDSKDKLKCDRDGKNAHSGNCAYRFKADPNGDSSALTFKTSEVALAETVLYDFRAYVSSKALSPDLAIGKAKLVFTDGIAETIKLYPELPYADYELLAEAGRFDRGGRTLKKITIQFSYPATSGKLWLDDVSFKITIDVTGPLLNLP